MTRKKITALLTSIVMFVMVIIPSASVASASETMRDISTMELVRDMGIGINLGNTLEACGDWIDGKDTSSYETAWGSPVITKEMIENVLNGILMLLMDMGIKMIIF